MNVWDTLHRRVVKGIGVAAVLALAGCSGEDGAQGPQGPAGPPGTVASGAVGGQVEIWEDLFTSSQRRTDVSAGGVTVMLVGADVTLSEETDFQGRYQIADVPSGVYTAVAFRDSAAVDGYGPVREYNFFVGNGTSFFSPDLPRRALPPQSVQVQGGAANDGTPFVEINWAPGSSTAINAFRVWVAPLDGNTGQRSPVRLRLFDQVLALRAQIRLAQLVQLIGPGVFFFGVSANNSIRYFDERLGRFVDPSESATTWIDQSAVFTDQSETSAPGT